MKKESLKRPTYIIKTYRYILSTHHWWVVFVFYIGETRWNVEGIRSETEGGIAVGDHCVFCNPELDRDQRIVMSNETCLFLQLHSAQKQGAPLNGSGVIVPKQHRDNTFDLTKEEWNDTFSLLKLVKEQLDETVKPDGYNIGWNCGEVAGQHLFHAHLHVLPRYKDEPMAGKGIRYLFKNQGGSL